MLPDIKVTPNSDNKWTLIERHRRRGSSKDCYSSKEAHQSSVLHRSNANKYKIPTERIDFIRFLEHADWSHEQISNVLTMTGTPVSHE